MKFDTDLQNTAVELGALRIITATLQRELELASPNAGLVNKVRPGLCEMAATAGTGVGVGGSCFPLQLGPPAKRPCLPPFLPVTPWQALYTLGWLIRGNPALQSQFAASGPWAWLTQLLTREDKRVQLKALSLLSDLALEEGTDHALLTSLFAEDARCSAVVDAVACCKSSDGVEKVSVASVCALCACVCNLPFPPPHPAASLPCLNMPTFCATCTHDLR